MKPETIHSKASILASEDKVRARIKELQSQAIERNKATLDEVLMVLADIIRFDPAEMYDENGNLLPINKMPKKVRLCIQSFESCVLSKTSTQIEGFRIDKSCINC